MAIADTASIILDWPVEGCTLAEAYQRTPSFTAGTRPDGVITRIARDGVRLEFDIALRTLKNFCERELRPLLEGGELIVIDHQPEPIPAALIRYIQFDPDSGTARGPDTATIHYAIRIYRVGTWKPRSKAPLLVKHDGPIETKPLVKRKHKQKKAAGRVGAPPIYDNPAIQAVARDVLKQGIPVSQAQFFKEVRDACDDRGIRYHDSTRFREVVLPIYEAGGKTGKKIR
jgi:hypothetical protein